MIVESPAAAGSVSVSQDKDLRAEISRAIEKRTAAVGVIGLGYVGLPLAEAFYSAGFPVCGFDVDKTKIEALQRGDSYIERVSSTSLKTAIEKDRFTVTDDFHLLRRMEVIIICVPTPLTRNQEPELCFIEKTANQIRRYLDRGQLVILESTTYPGTTEEVLLPILEDSGLEVGRDIFLAYSPLPLIL